MTKEEIIEGLKLLEDNMVYFDELLNDKGEYIDVHELLFEAIEVLSAEPCDCISRAEAIDALGYDISIESDEGLDAYKTVIKEMLCKIYDVQKENIEKLPSIQPKTDVLDKIRAEIAHLHDWAFSREGILRIIDKYKAESEEQE